MGSALSMFGFTHLGSSLSVRQFARLGSTLSVLNKVHVSDVSVTTSWPVGASAKLSVIAITEVGSSMSLRSFRGLGSSLSLLGVSRVGSSLSVFDYVNLGSSLSIRGFARLGSSLSVFAFSHFGSSLSLRGFARLGSSISHTGVARCTELTLTTGLSVLNTNVPGSSLSVRSFARLGSAFSVFNLSELGSSLALRSLSRLGSSMSLFSRIRLGSSVSVFDFGLIGSSMSVRSFARFGSNLSITSATKLLMGADNKVVNFGATASNTYIYYDIASASNTVGFYVNGAEILSMEDAGTPSPPPALRGNLHGAWTYTSSWTDSDRRLKKDIKPLRRTLAEFQTENVVEKGPRGGSAEDGALWTLRQLRPVSYYFKQGSESKYMRFGFIADELESVVPNVVRTTADTRTGLKDAKSIQINDIVALLAAAGQSQQHVIDTQERLMDQVEAEFEAFKAELKVLHQLKEKKRQANRALACGATRKKRRRPWWR